MKAAFGKVHFVKHNQNLWTAQSLEWPLIVEGNKTEQNKMQKELSVCLKMIFGCSCSDC